MKAARIEDQVCLNFYERSLSSNNEYKWLDVLDEQVKSCSDQNRRLAEDRCQNSVSLDNIQRRLLESRKFSHHAKESLEELQSKVKDGRANLSGLQIELDKERYFDIILFFIYKT